MFREVLSVRFEWYLQTHVHSFSNHLNHQQKPTDTYGRQHPLINILLTKVIKQIVSRNGNQHVYQINIAYRRVYPINNKQDTHCFLRKRAGNSLPTDARKSNRFISCVMTNCLSTIGDVTVNNSRRKNR